ncbi:TIGR02611 family protein [Streptomyces parvulus]|uniref:TIGR02611 family protein n=1 Tax=Streptomyces parvulus TaxID=146923 RepID=A0A369UYF5_9ACTN|nr:TIGR02611 family protein [Streptomyces parvulus]RDD84620.1 TIGR02611 family protein [Streptomyces parvulus]
MSPDSPSRPVALATIGTDHRDGQSSSTARRAWEPVPSEKSGSKAPGWARRHPVMYTGWRCGVFLAGLAVVVAGVIMLPLPGPGWLVIFAGMALWGTEFAWAQRVLHWTRRRVAEATRRALEPRVRRRNIVLLLIGATAGAVLVTLYLLRFGAGLPPAVGG